LPQGKENAYIKVSTTLSTTNIVILPQESQNIEGDQEGFTIDKISGAI
jgi:hypothetical protein